LGGGLAYFGLAGLGVEIVLDRLVVDLGADGQAAVLSWPDSGVPEELSRAPLTWPLDGNALEDLRWYLEDYLQAPFGVWEDRGPAVRERLAGWGDQVFGTVFGAGPARDAYQRARDRGLEVVFRSADPGLLGLPWELMRDETGPVALGAGGISRSLPVAGGAPMLEVPGGKLRVLMVISRPAGTADVGYQMVARPLLERLEAVRGEVDLMVLRPPTFDALRQVVKRAADAGAPFHVVHFDGHGAMLGRTGSGEVGGRPAMMSGPGEGVLAFEQPGGGSDLVRASQVAAVLAEGRVPVVVLNACQSGAVGKELEASVATALLKAGCAAVVAMAYSVYAVAAAEFMAEFYESLFAGGSVGQAVTAGRKRLSVRAGRPSPKGDMPLADWLVPVHYMRREVRFPDARTVRPAAAPPLAEMLDQIRAAPSKAVAAADPLAAVGVFVGRDDLFYQLETAARLQRVVVLNGHGGSGKTELAKGFARWQRDTGGVDDPRLVCWHSFEPGVASFGLDGVITGIGLGVFGTDFARLDPEERLEAVKQLLAQYRGLLVWDNFESVKEMPDPAGATPPLDGAGCARLLEFLDWVRDHSVSMVIITSRAREDWLGQVRRIRVGGLNRAEAAQYAGYLLAPYPAAQRQRERRSFGELLDWLEGHPLAMRLTLPRLDDTDPAALVAGLRGTVPLPGGDAGEGRLSSLGACITYSFAHLGDQARRLLPAVSLFHGIADVTLLGLLSSNEAAPGRFAGISVEEWTAVLEDAARVGLLARISGAMYRIHPALPSYLAAGWQAASPDGYDQERNACEQALCTACADLSEWTTSLMDSADAALGYSIIGLQRRTLGTMLDRALDHRAWGEAQSIAGALDQYWAARGLREEAAAWADRILEATAEHGQAGSEPVSVLWLQTTLSQANWQLLARKLDKARQNYQQALSHLQALPSTEANRANIAVFYHQLGITAHDLGQLDEADEWYRRAIQVREELGLRRQLAGDYYEVGVTAHTRGRLDEAEDWCRKSLVIQKELGDRLSMGNTYHQLGIIAFDQGQLDEAEEYYQRAAQIHQEIGQRSPLAASYHELGVTARTRGRLDEAEDWCRKSLAIKEELGSRPGMAITYHELGIIAYARRRLDEAEDWSRKSLAISEELGNLPLMAITYLQLGATAEAQGQNGLALEWYVRCVTLFDQFPSPQTRTGPSNLARLTRDLGMPALERSWRQVTGQPVPQPVRDYITSHQDEQSEDTS
jgi:tetratricopeptide (TPR) repeat protein